MLKGELTFQDEPKSKKPTNCKLFKKLLEAFLPLINFTKGTLNSEFKTNTLYPSNLLKLYPLRLTYSPKIKLLLLYPLTTRRGSFIPLSSEVFDIEFLTPPKKYLNGLLPNELP